MFVHWWGVIRHVYGRTIQRARYPSHNRKGWQRIPVETNLQNTEWASREFIKQIDWEIGYDTPDQAEKAGMLISKKWIDAAKPNL
jgi:hypothetical protein